MSEFKYLFEVLFARNTNCHGYWKNKVGNRMWWGGGLRECVLIFFYLGVLDKTRNSNCNYLVVHCWKSSNQNLRWIILLTCQIIYELALRLLLVVLFWFRKIMNITFVLFLQYKRVLALIETTLWGSGCTLSSFHISCLSQQLLESNPYNGRDNFERQMKCYKCVTISSGVVYYIQFVHIPRETHILACLLEDSFHAWRVRSEGYLGVSFVGWGSLGMMPPPPT